MLDQNSLYYSHFNPSHPTKIIIHGFGGGRNNSPSPDIREAYFSIGNYNIIIVDYADAVKEPCLSQMDWSPRFGSLCVSQLVKYLSRHPRGVKPDELHFIGYSVGAHIAGLVANYLKPEEGKLGRITGLDPTIFFYAGFNNSRDLDSTDAHFVDVLHTGAGILGQWHSTGHADFYVNGGTNQPGCSGSTTIFREYFWLNIFGEVYNRNMRTFCLELLQLFCIKGITSHSPFRALHYLSTNQRKYGG